MSESKLTEEFLALTEVDRFQELYSSDIREDLYFGAPLASIIEAEKRLRDPEERQIAYFSMEYGLASSFYNTFSLKGEINPHNKIPSNTVFSNYRLADYFFDVSVENLLDLPIYSGGLGVLAGDTVKTMADYKLPAVAIGILWHSGYFRQRFWFKHGQVPEKMKWDPLSYPGLVPLKNTVTFQLKSETLRLKLWKYYVFSYKYDYAIPLVLLDANIDENPSHLRMLTDQLYRSDNAWIKLMQRLVLGFGGMAALRELGYPAKIFHLNEGHAAFAFIDRCRGLSDTEIKDVQRQFAYTCHTLVEAGHDRFSQDVLDKVLTQQDYELVRRFGQERSGAINLTLLAMNTSGSINAVSKNHQQVMRLQFPEYSERIKYVTNGVHPYTWLSQNILNVLKRFSPEFDDIDRNPMALARAADLKGDRQFRTQLWQAHQQNKQNLCDFLGKWKLASDVFTVCWARRIAAYKRPSLILHDIERLEAIVRNAGPLQIILAGKAHPNDNLGFTFVNQMLDKVDSLVSDYDNLKVIILENYDTYLARLLVSGVDVWLNNPLPPFEASGTSGMKAILNGVLQLTTLDGWVVEAAEKGLGRIFGYINPPGKIGDEKDLHMEDDAAQLYDSLEEMAKLYYKTFSNNTLDPASEWIDMMINCIGAAHYFNTYRMLDEYRDTVWLGLGDGAPVVRDRIGAQG